MMTRDGEVVEFVETDFRARAIQHEIDHLDGILFTTKAVRLYRDEVPVGATKKRTL